MKPRCWLAVEGALGGFSAAIRDGERELADGAAGKEALERGLGLITDVLRNAGLALSEIDAVAVGTGPGSFTGLRIAVSYAKGLAFALKLPLAGVSSYDVLDDGTAPAPVLAVAHGRPDIACARLRMPDGTFTKCGNPDTIAKFVHEHVCGGAVATYGALQGVVERLGERGLDVRAFPVPDFPARTVARLAAERFRESGQIPQVHELVLDYGELPPADVPGLARQ